MNAELRQNTIKRIERHGFTVADNGGKKYPHAIVGPSPYGPQYYTVKRQLNDNQLYDFADTLDALAHVGRLTKVDRA